MIHGVAKFVETESRMVVARGWEEQGRETLLLNECSPAILPLTHTRKLKMLDIFVAFLIPPDLTTSPLPVVSISRRDYLESLSR